MYAFYLILYRSQRARLIGFSICSILLALDIEDGCGHDLSNEMANFLLGKKCSKTDYLFVDETGFDDKRKWVSVKMFDKVENPECRSASKILTRANFSSSKNKVQEVILSIQEKSELQTSQNTVGIWYTDVSWSHRGWAANGPDFKWLPN